MLGIYRHGTSYLHRARPATKLCGLALVAMVLFLPATPMNVVAASLAATVTVIAGFAVARIPAAVAFAQVKPAFIILAAIFAFHLIMGQWITGGLIVWRFIVLIALAALVTLTTRVTDMIDTIETALTPLARFIDPGRVAMCLVLAIRFVPVLANEAQAIREAQAARGAKRAGPTAFIRLAVPLILRGLRLAETVAEALYARGYGQRAVGDGPAKDGSTEKGREAPGATQPE